MTGAVVPLLGPGEIKPAPQQGLYHPTLGVFDFQADGAADLYVRFTENIRDARLAIWSTGIGKALRVDQRVATPEGWREIGSLRVGDLVFGPDGQSARVVGVYPQGHREMWRVAFNDGTSVVVDDEHLWAVRTRGMKNKGLRWRVWTTKQIRESGLIDSQGYGKHFIPLTDPVQFPERELPLDPYFIGALLGDGGLTQRTPRLTSEDEDLVQGLTLPVGVNVVRYDYGKRTPSYAFVAGRRKINPVTEGLVALGLMGLGSHDKFIPDAILWGSVEQRVSCLQGLLDTDGYCGTSIEFCSVAEKLVRGVQHLVQSLGGTAKARKTEVAWRVRISLPATIAPFRLARKAMRWNRQVDPTRRITTITPSLSGEAVCIKVDREDGLFLTEDFIVTHNTHLAMAVACLLIEDNIIDHMLVVAEQNKVKDWANDDVPKHTDLTAGIYLGPRRAKTLADPPQVIVTTYETFRNDVAKFRAKSNAIIGSGPLLEWMRSKRVLLVYDEITKLRGRTSKLHIAHDYALNRTLRRHGSWVRTLGLTATSVERSPEDIFNVARILAPDLAGTVEGFQQDYIAAWDIFGNPCQFKNIFRPGNEKMPWDGYTTPLIEKLAPLVLRKRKSDADVRDQFPAMIEEPPTFVELGARHQDFYDAVEEEFADADPYEQRVVFGLLRQIAGHPRSLLRSQGKYARALVEMVGEDGLNAMGSAKEDHLIERIHRLGSQQGVAFTFYGQSILPLLQERMQHEGISLVVNHGGLSPDQRYQAQQRFKAGDAQIFLSSDAGARGLNLGVGSWLCHYELPLLFSVFRQRSDRIHRIDSIHDSVNVESVIAARTIEDSVAEVLLKRNQWSDAIDHAIHDEDYIEDADPTEGHLSAEARAALLRRARDRVKK